MTVEATQTKEIYEGNGSTTVFPVLFSYGEASDIKLKFTDVHEVEWDVTSNFQITVNEGGNTNVLYPVVGTPIDMGTRLTVYRDTPQTQILDLIYGGAFNPDVLEHDGFDRLVMMIQEIQEGLERAVKAPFTSDMDPDALLDSIYDEVRKAEAAAASAQDALSQCQALVAIIPSPTVADAGKVIAVRVVNGKPQYELVMQSGGGGGGGGGTGYSDYTIPAMNSDGKVVVRLADIGHPEMPGLFNPVINLISIAPHYYCLTNRSPEEFTVQIYNPDGTPGVEVSEYLKLGTFNLGSGARLGQKGTGTLVELAVSIPMPPA